MSRRTPAWVRISLWGAALAVAAVVLLAGPAPADDCTDWGDCAMAPRNINGATGLAAVLPPITLLYLYLTRRGAPDAAPPVPAVIPTVDDLRDEFDRLQEELRTQAVQELSNIDAFMRKYDEKWREGMFALEDYLQEYEHILPDLEKIWEQFGSREDARRIAEALDTAIMVVSIGVGLVRGAASTAAREALQTARRAGTRLEAEAARRAAREALGKEVQALQAAERAAARRVGREGADAARDVAGRQAAEVANNVRRAMQEGRGTGKLVLADDLTTNAMNIPPKPGYFDVVIHGDRNGMSILRNGKWIDVSPKGLKIIMEAHGYKGGPVRLISCETGGKLAAGKFQPGAAKALSQELKAPVMAPSESAWVRSDGTMWVSETQYGPIQHWTSYGMRQHGVSSGALTAEEARALGYLR